MIKDIPPALHYPALEESFFSTDRKLGDKVEFKCVPGTFQGYHWNHAVRVERGISVEEALDIAANDPNIDYFCYTTAGQLVLNFIPGEEYKPEEDPLHLIYPGGPTKYLRLFHYGDVVFFAKDDSKKYYGDAGPLGVSYEKVR
jgi:hypothetical protein